MSNVKTKQTKKQHGQKKEEKKRKNKLSSADQHKYCAYPQWDSLARFWEIIWSSHGEMGQRLTRRVAFKVAFSLFLAFDFVTLTMENPDSHKYVVVKGNTNLIARFDREGYWLAASIQNEARSTCVSWSFRLLSVDSFIGQFSNTVDKAFWSRIHRERVQRLPCCGSSGK